MVTILDSGLMYSHYCKIQDYDEQWYQQFHIVVCGLDSVLARRWINNVLISLLQYDDGELDQVCTNCTIYIYVLLISLTISLPISLKLW